MVEEYISLFRTGIANVMDSPIVKLSQSLRKKLLKFGTPEWFERICISTEEYLRIGVLGAVDVWRNKNPYTIDNYMLNREYDSGVYTCIDMVEIVADIDLSAEVRNDRRVQKLRKLTARHVAFTNDLYSYNKEVPKHANPNNLVYLLMHWKKLSFDESVSEIVKIINSDMESFLQLKKEVLSDERCTSVSLQKYIAGMEHWMSGNIDWSIQTSRYKVNAPAILV
ncbi:MAG: hypothetical protein IPJ81_16725 [Chitinophagaceae bacterium]|nr:hypothetical protein [Chitinophagaceae bacterium]